MMPLAVALNLGLRLGLVARESLEPLIGKTVSLDVTDLGLEVRVRYGAAAFRSSPSRPDVTIRSTVSGFLALLLRREDPDTLFFTRRLVITGDTDLGLVVKNVLDAIDWSRLPRPIRASAHALRTARMPGLPAGRG
jgi:predicted lipid carrier protein YhbT